MDGPKQGPNPLRPYYVPPSIGETATPAINATASPSKAPAASPSFTFPDLDYSEYIPDGSPSAVGSLKSLLEQAVWKYSSVLMAQPFEVAKLILQVRVAQESDLDEPAQSRRSSAVEGQSHEEDAEDSSDEEPNFFASNAQFGQSTSSPPRGRRGRPLPSRTSSQRSTGPPTLPGRLELKNSHSLIDALSSLSSKSGALSMWKGTNTAFIHNILSKTLETFFRSFLAALFGIAEQDVLFTSSSTIPDSSVLSSISPAATVLIATAAASLSALVLAPVDAAKTRLILTPSTDEPRTLLGTLRTLSPAYLIPGHLIPITVLTSTIPTFLSNVTPFVLRSYFGLDPAMNSTSWSMATFASSALDLSVKFPLETVLRRAQIVTWTSPPASPPRSVSKNKAVNTIVPVPQAYRGVLPTLWGIMRDEGYSESQKDKTAALMGKAPRRKRKGQGIQGLYRGWRVGLWGLVGIWGTGFVGGLQGGVEAGASAHVQAGKF